MKKCVHRRLIEVLLAVMVLAVFMSVGACSLTQTHSHKFSKEWTYNESEHWHGATCEHDVTSERGAHNFENDECTVCGYDKAVADGHEHTYSEEWSKDSSGHWHDADCGHNLTADFGEHVFEDGECTVCGYPEEHIHNLIPHERIAPTCEESGTEKYWECSGCGEKFGDADGTQSVSDDDLFIAALGHKYGEWNVVEPASCTEKGKEERVCENDVSHKEIRDINALGHDIKHYEGKDPTCTQAGYDAYDECTRGDYTTYNEIPASGHKFEDDICTVCGEKYATPGLEYKEIYGSDDRIVAYEVIGIGDATDKDIRIAEKIDGIPVTRIGLLAFNGAEFINTITVGKTVEFIDRYAFYNLPALKEIYILNEEVDLGGRLFVYLCSDLKTVYYAGTENEWKEYGLLELDDIDIVYNYGHNYEEISRDDATCSKTGSVTYQCSDCNRTYSVVLEQTEHQWNVEDTVDATCTKDGYKILSCSICGEQSSEILAAKGHDVAEYVTVIEATCTNSGIERGECSVCGEEVERYIAAKGHTEGEFESDGDDECNGHQVGTIKCLTCGEIIYSFGHNYKRTIQQATCTQDGQITDTCRLCGKVVTEKIESFGHIENGWETEKKATCSSEGTEKKTCAVCGETLATRSVDKTAHTYQSSVEGNTVTYRCTVCGDTYTKTNTVQNYTITFDTNGADSLPSLIVEAGEVPVLPEPAKLGYVFVGWYLNEELTNYYLDYPIYEDTTLYAAWVGEAITGEIALDLLEMDVDPDFTFDIKSSVALNASNLSKYVSVYDGLDESVAIEIQSQTDGVYTIAGKNPYEAGETYRVKVDARITLVDREGQEFWFMVRGEEKHDITYKDNIILISLNDIYGACEKDEESMYVILYSDLLDVGDLAVFYDKDEYDIQAIAEVTVEYRYESYYAYEVISADPEEVFDDLDVYSSEDMSFDDFVPAADLEEELVEQFEASPVYAQFVYAAQEFASESNVKYTFDYFKIKPAFSVKNSKLTITLEVSVEYSRKSSLYNGSLKFTMIVKNEFGIRPVISGSFKHLKLKFSAALEVTNVTTVGLYVDSSVNSKVEAHKELTYFKNLFLKAKESDEVKKLDEQQASSSKTTKIGEASVNFYGFKLYLKLNNVFQFNAVGNLGAESTTTITTKFGASYNSSSGFSTIWDFRANFKMSLYLYAKLEVSDMVQIEAGVSFLGVVNLSASFSAGPYFEMAGRIEATIENLHGYVAYGGYIEIGVKVNVSVHFNARIKLLFWWVNIFDKTWTIYDNKFVLYSAGDKEILLCFSVYEGETAEFTLDGKQSANLDAKISKTVRVQNLKTLKESTKTVSCEYYLITPSPYIIITKDGYVYMADNLPLNGPIEVQVKVVYQYTSKIVTLIINVKHTPTMDTQNPTCTENGKKITHCANCKNAIMDVQEIPATGHKWGTTYIVDKQPTCEGTGLQSYHCTVCGAINENEQVEIPATGHKFSTYWSFDEDYHWYKALCGHEELEQKIPHSYDNGYACTGCGYYEEFTRGLTFTLMTSNGEQYYEITGYTGSSQTVIIPSRYRGINVKSIGDNSFRNKTNIINVKIGSGVTSIGSYAFYNCTGLTGELKIPDSVTSIEYGTFSGCKRLTGELKIPDSVTSIGGSAFWGCSGLTGELKIPDSVTSIGSYAFYGCSGLTGELKIPDSVTSIEYGTFSGCSGLTGELKIPDSVTSIGSGAFNGSIGLKTITLPDSVMSIGSQAFYNCSGLTSVKYTGTLEGWCKIDFAGSDSNPLTYAHELYLGDELITEADLPETIAEIKKYTFDGCTSITKITIPNTVTSIGSYAFYGCSGLTGELKLPEKLTSIGDWAFYNCSGLTGELKIRDGVTSIGTYAFRSCSGLTSLVIGDSVTSIGSYAFYGCSGLTSLVIGDSVTSIGSYAFYDCSALTSLVMGDGVTSIENSTFSGCKGLTGELKIPDGVTSIGSYAFYDCSALTSLMIGSGVMSIGDHAFSGCSGLTGELKIPDSVTSIEYGTFSGCKGLTGELKIPDSVTSIGYDAFWGCSGFTGELKIPDSVTSIESYAFSGCSGLTNVVIGSGVTSIEYGTFSGCSGLTGELKIPVGVTSIGSSAFQYCRSLTGELKIPDGVTSIGSSAFQYCSGLTSVVIGSGVTSIGSSAFQYCSGLEQFEVNEGNLTYSSLDGVLYDKAQTQIFLVPKAIKGVVTIPSTITKIGDSVFRDCSGLTGELKIPDSVTSIGDDAFYGCSGLTSLVIGSCVASIGEWAFYDCSGLTGELKIPDGVTSIGSSAFYGCSGLTSVKYTGTLEGWCKIDFASSNSNPLYYAHELYIGDELLTEANIPKTITEIKNYVFEGCTSITKVTIPNTITSIGNSAFYDCGSLTGEIKIPDSVTSIGSNAFGGCSGLTSIVIGSGVTSIGSGAFYDCSDLTNLVIGSSVTSIGFQVISTGKNVLNVNYMGTIEDWLTMTCDTNWGNWRLYIKNELLTEVEITKNIIEIRNGAFWNCKSIKNVNIPNSVTRIGVHAFDSCSSLTEMFTIPDSVTSIGVNAFASCRFRSVIIGSGVTSIGVSAFIPVFGFDVVYYKGDVDAWNNISIDSGNDYLKNAKRYYYSANPNYDGKHWHYNSETNGPEVWKNSATVSASVATSVSAPALVDSSFSVSATAPAAAPVTALAHDPVPALVLTIHEAWTSFNPVPATTSINVPASIASASTVPNLPAITHHEACLKQQL